MVHDNWVHHQGQMYQASRSARRNQSLHNKHFAKLEDVKLGIVRMGIKDNEYVEAGGDTPSDRIPKWIFAICYLAPFNTT